MRLSRLWIAVLELLAFLSDAPSVLGALPTSFDFPGALWVHESTLFMYLGCTDKSQTGRKCTGNVRKWPEMHRQNGQVAASALARRTSGRKCSGKKGRRRQVHWQNGQAAISAPAISSSGGRCTDTSDGWQNVHSQAGRIPARVGIRTSVCSQPTSRRHTRAEKHRHPPCFPYEKRSHRA